MREYCKVSPQFWTGATGKEGAWKALRSLSEAQFAYFDDASEHVFMVEEDEGREGSTVMATTHSNGRAGSWDAPG